MLNLKMYPDSRYNFVPRIYDEDEGFMVMPFCPEFSNLYSYSVKPTDTISGIAKQFYGDSRYQWAVLSANELPFPPVLQTGTTIYLPSPDEVLDYDGGQ